MQKADTTTLFKIEHDGRTHYVIPPHGYVDRIEIRPRIDLPNMDAGRCVTLVFDVYDGDGNAVPVDVLVTARDVTT